MAIIESNQMRRAHRVNIPLTIAIDGKAYLAHDWSMTGVGIDGFEKELTYDEVLNASIILALQEAKIEIPVKLQFKVKRGEISGFEFAYISEKNKRVLREFLELAIEGKLNNIDGLLSVYNEPIIDSPIKESVVFSDEEESALKQSFAKRSKLYLFFGFILLILLFGTIYYNTTYVYRSIGIVSGNFIKITPSISGKIAKIYHHTGDKVHKKELLFELDDTKIINQLKIIETKLASLKGVKYVTQKSSLLPILRKDMQQKKRTYDATYALYTQKLITRTELQRAQNNYTKARIAYIEEKNKGIVTNTNDPKILALITQLKLQKEELLNKLNYLRVFSANEGRIYALKYNEGNYVSMSDVVMVLETLKSSFVVCKLTQQEVQNIQVGMPVKIYSSTTDTTYDATVQAVGNLSLNPESEITNEVSLKEVTVKIVFNNPNLQLPLNERVKVWFHRPLW